MPLYNCVHSGDQYRITKFDADLNVESSYLCTETECECPAAHRDTCRHRTMLPRFIRKSATAANWFHNFETNQWIKADVEESFTDSVDELASEASQAVEPIESPATLALTPEPLIGHAFTMLDLAAITPKPHSVTVNTPDFDSGNGGSNPPVAAIPTPFLRRI